ncbi:MAG: hypothetical protein A2Y03_08245 [Omnitrophica WOR_2 bacterium GWF2_38_59]|nr:MAG: hypothetical protein A2Y06_01480 [Omnitrophica WOR_2 bacterium GWA2_37_7]OGX25482.1 MAG: hypothetical protein A2Y03_08245 [Omnitrophica WOR_2 bacterium GWF2_38_59]OGX48126.1 MAG: hypothetical protein A2243_02930 [Omnitrophica WOR_2 bacterium RIFOXYA2_FULL_38_17]OGX54723.1 MAG: hypothetical protein A2267_08420 [Omnitrophica WOR_2 bacterium RIFOXYA12_FULL_38_10]OGX56406.1 MAG: hypothetical protein A2447_10420 [Omnitrophica WOR_2 bacterium RIFOXYC2_FULL_38_12]OGX58462.1 MAG: hypothetical 
MARALYMNFKNLISRERAGSVLILALWTVVFLSVFAVQIGMKIQQKATMLLRLETRSKLHYIADAGIKKAIASIRMDISRNGDLYTSYGKYYRHNNPDKFKGIVVGDGYFDVSYPYYGSSSSAVEIKYGVVDAESKININVAPQDVIVRLIMSVLGLDQEDAAWLANNIIDWREFGQSHAEGFYSNEYYSNLEFPYEIKSKPFELIDELLLVEGFTEDVYERLYPFITVYGDGLVNINTASYQVLYAIGLSQSVIDKFLMVRRGFDDKDFSVDDHIFHKTFDMAVDMLAFTKLEISEIREIDLLNLAQRIKTNSSFYLIGSRARIRNKEEVLEAVCVYNALENRIEYWREK